MCALPGTLKAWLYYEQIDRDLATLEEMEELLSGPNQLHWATRPAEAMPSQLWWSGPSSGHKGVGVPCAMCRMFCEGRNIFY